MGSGASIQSGTSIADLTTEQVAEFIASLGNAYTGYKELIINNGIDGKTIGDLDDDGMMQYFNEMGITSIIHKKKNSQRI